LKKTKKARKKFKVAVYYDFNCKISSFCEETFQNCKEILHAGPKIHQNWNAWITRKLVAGFGCCKNAT